MTTLSQRGILLDKYEMTIDGIKSGNTNKTTISFGNTQKSQSTIISSEETYNYEQKSINSSNNLIISDDLSVPNTNIISDRNNNRTALKSIISSQTALAISHAEEFNHQTLDLPIIFNSKVQFSNALALTQQSGGKVLEGAANKVDKGFDKVNTFLKILLQLAINAVNNFVNSIVRGLYIVSLSVLSLPAYANNTVSSVRNLQLSLSDSSIRRMWVLEKKLSLRHLVSIAQKYATGLWNIVRQFYLAMVVVTSLFALAIISVNSTTIESSKAGNLVKNSAILDSDSSSKLSVASSYTVIENSTVKFIPPTKSLIVQHPVQEGETIEKISSYYNISAETARYNNNLSVDQQLTPGESVFLPTTDSYIYFASEEISKSELSRIYNVEEAVINDYNPLLKDESVFIKDSIVLIPIDDFKLVDEYNTKEQDRIATAEKQAEQAKINEQARVAALQSTSFAVSYSEPNSSTVADTGFQWPTASRIISCGFYCYAGHAAIDIVSPSVSNPPIQSISGGVVVEARSGCGCPKNSSYGYGNYVVVDHGGGYKSLYAHLGDVLSVSVGDTVSKGQTVGYMSNSGWAVGSTGIHLHFEVIKDGYRLNPLSVLP